MMIMVEAGVEPRSLSRAEIEAGMGEELTGGGN